MSAKSSKNSNKQKSHVAKTKTSPAHKLKAPNKLPSAYTLSISSFKILWQNKKLFILVILIYSLSYLVLVLGFSSPADSSTIKSALSNASIAHPSTLYSGLGAYSYLLGSSSSSSSSSGSAYQIVILVLASLAIIWSLRMLYNNKKIKARDAYYKGLYPIAGYVLVILFIGLELLPLLLGISLYAVAFQGGVTFTLLEKVLILLISLGLSLITFYLICSSVIALYIVTLEDMTPLKALRSAKALVKSRRLLVFRKLIFLPFSLIIIGAIIMLPFILVVPVIAIWIFFILSMIALTYAHSYCYSLYRGLIND